MSSSSARPELTRWRLAITAAFGLGGITISAWGPRLPAIKAGLNVGTATIGLLLAGVTVGAMLRQWLRGWLNLQLLLIGLVMLGVELGEGSANSWLTLAARNDHGQSAAVAALFVAAFAAAPSFRPRQPSPEPAFTSRADSVG